MGDVEYDEVMRSLAATETIDGGGSPRWEGGLDDHEHPIPG